MILNYLILFSLLVMSVIKASELFHKANRDLNHSRTEFIKLTKKTHQNGSIGIAAAVLVVMLSALLYFYVSKFKIELQEARFRKNNYLCFNYLNIKTENYMTDMTRFNWLLRGAFATMASGVATAKAKAAFEALKIARNTIHLKYVKDLTKNSYCKNPALSYLKNLPYKSSLALVLETNIDGTTKLRSPQWDVISYSKISGVRFKESFCLKAQWSAKGAFQPDLKIKTEEISMKGLSSLKCLSGFQ
jgi:hypothetical protein